MKKLRFYMACIRIILKDDGGPCRQKWRRIARECEKAKNRIGL